MRHTAGERERIWKRSLAIAEMVRGMSGHDEPPGPDDDLSSDQRHRWEGILGLPHGALSWHRFSGQFAGWVTPRVVAHWYAERASGCLIVDGDTGERVDDVVLLGPAGVILDTLGFIGIEPQRSLWLTGSEDVARELLSLNVEVPNIRRHPRGVHFERFDLVVICRGPAMHKHFNPWTKPIGRLLPPLKPVLITTETTNISGIATDVYSRREVIRQDVRSTRAA